MAFRECLVFIGCLPSILFFFGGYYFDNVNVFFAQHISIKASFSHIVQAEALSLCSQSSESSYFWENMSQFDGHPAEFTALCSFMSLVSCRFALITARYLCEYRKMQEKELGVQISDFFLYVYIVHFIQFKDCLKKSTQKTYQLDGFQALMKHLDKFISVMELYRKIKLVFTYITVFYYSRHTKVLV